MSGRAKLPRDEDLELRVADWLQDGPFLAPAESVEAVLERVRRAPRRHRTLERLQRVVLGMPPGDALEIGVRPRTRLWVAAAASIVVAVSLLATFGLGVLLPPAATPHPSASMAASPSPDGTSNPSRPAPTLLELPAVIAGTSVCTDVDTGTQILVGTTRLTTGIVVKCSDRWADARLTGVGYRYYTTEVAADLSQRWYGTGTIVNDGGAWSGIWTGTQAPHALNLSNTTFWLGTKGYAGLQARVWVEIGDNGVTVSRPGVLEVVGPVDSMGQAACGPAAPPDGGAPAPGQRSLTCLVTASEDPRLSGTRTLTLTLSKRADGSFMLAGSSRIENEAGAWAGSVTGTLASDGATYAIDETLTGSTLYAGYSFSGHLAGPLDGLSIVGTVTPVP